MLTITCSVTLIQRSKTDLSAVVKHKLGAFAQHHPPQPHRLHTQSRRNFNKRMQLLTVIRPPRQFRVARRCSPSACRTDYPYQLLHQRQFRNLALHAIQAVQPTRHQPPQRPLRIRCAHRPRRLLRRGIRNKILDTNPSSACLQPPCRACQVSPEASRTHLTHRIKSANRSLSVYGRLRRLSTR
jgi:hypothetical protein